MTGKRRTLITLRKVQFALYFGHSLPSYLMFEKLPTWEASGNMIFRKNYEIRTTDVVRSKGKKLSPQ